MSEFTNLYSEEYMKLAEEILTNPSLMRAFLFSMVVSMVVGVIICFVITKASKLHIGYTAFGLLGTMGIFIVLCRSMAKTAGTSGYFMWLGLLGMYGVIIMAIIMIVSSTKRMKEQMKKGNQNGPYNQGTGSYSNDWERQYEEGKKENEEQQGYNLNGEHVEPDHGTICLSCGTAVAAGEKNCPRCGNKVK